MTNSKKEESQPTPAYDDFFITEDKRQKLVRYLSAEECSRLKIIGSGGSPLGVTLQMAFKHTPNFFDRVVGYAVSESEDDLGAMVQAAMREVFPDHEQAKPGMNITYTFYGEPHKKEPLSFGIIGGVRAPKPLDPDEDINNPENEMYQLHKTLKEMREAGQNATNEKIL